MAQWLGQALTSIPVRVWQASVWFLLPAVAAFAISLRFRSENVVLPVAVGEVADALDPRLLFDSATDVALGSCVGGLDYDVVVQLTNPLREQLVVRRFETSCGCNDFEFPDHGLSLAPGASFLHAGRVPAKAGGHWLIYHCQSPYEGSVAIPVRLEMPVSIAGVALNGQELAATKARAPAIEIDQDGTVTATISFQGDLEWLDQERLSVDLAVDDGRRIPLIRGGGEGLGMEIEYYLDSGVSLDATGTILVRVEYDGDRLGVGLWWARLR